MFPLPRARALRAGPRATPRRWRPPGAATPRAPRSRRRTAARSPPPPPPAAGRAHGPRHGGGPECLPPNGPALGQGGGAHAGVLSGAISVQGGALPGGGANGGAGLRVGGRVVPPRRVGNGAPEPVEQ